MRILVDGQSFQTDSRNRGIGRYTEGLINGLCKNGADVVVLLNGSYEQASSEAFLRIKTNIPEVKVEFFFPFGNNSSLNINELDYFLSEQLYLDAVNRIRPDAFLCPSIFEVGQIFICPPLERISKICPVSAVGHDTIPLDDVQVNLPAHDVRNSYLSFLRAAFSVDLMLCNSRFTEKRFLHICPGLKTKVIWGASFTEDVKQIEKKNYVFYCGGLDPRKNVDFLCRSYAKLPYSIRIKYPLYICCRKNTDLAQKLNKFIKQLGIGSQIKLVEAEKNEDLARLYAECRLFVFPSKSEGLGLPLIEALTFRSPILTSQTTSLPEIVDNPEAWFSPYDENQLADKLFKALTDPNVMQRLQAYSEKNQNKFTWDKVGGEVLNQLSRIVAIKQRSQICNDIDLSFMTLPKLLKCEFLRSLAKQKKRTIYFDISSFSQTKANTGIQRVVKKFIQYLPEELENYNFDIAYISGNDSSKYQIICSEDGKWKILGDAYPVANDWYISVDLCANQILKHQKNLIDWKNRGVKLFIYVHDIIFNEHPEFVSDAKAANSLNKWLYFSLKYADCIMSNSCTVVENVKKFALRNEINIKKTIFLYQHLGTDFNSDKKNTYNKQNVHDREKHYQFICVSTIEPRKGYKQLLTSFMKALDEGMNAKLVIVGRCGWKNEDVVKLLKTNKYAGKQIIWENDCSDERLKQLYSQSDCFVFASYDEGFGLAIVEAAQFGVSLLLRDIPIFREIAGNHALYFTDDKLSEHLKKIVSKEENLPSLDGMEILTWKQSIHETAEQLVGLAKTEFLSCMKEPICKVASESVIEILENMQGNSNNERLIVRKYSRISRFKFKILARIWPSEKRRNHYKNKILNIPMPEFSTRPLSLQKRLRYKFGACFAPTKEKREHYETKLKRYIDNH